ncbi:hypothetical protein [Hymenobacter latericus]|uniref:hypothetical protein n=1 Tax=Hymenobacter sp. YIM 151858-1 TaxID=2987688 RepID=UPI002227AD08|nr:hypothetical protein [Hymenobacter sp. YIM 151858-1]UYZ60213.1 hypothetical protein OIS50_05285 [Hymenobacter sp. YIM 151858-1]
MQTAVILSAAEFQNLTARLDKLEQAEAARAKATTAKPDQVLTTAQAAAYIGLSGPAARPPRRPPSGSASQ